MEEKLYFKNSNGNKLCGVLTMPDADRTRPLIILCHGFNSSRESNTFISLSKKLAEKNIASFRFDFFAHGESEGNFEDLTVSQAVDDTICAIDYMRHLGYGKIGLMGSSFGGLSSFIAAAKTDFLFLLLQKAPVSSFAKIPKYMDKKLIENWKRTGYRLIEGKKLKYAFYEDSISISAYKVADQIHVPTFIIHGNRDLDVPLNQSIEISKLISNCTLEIMVGADHRFSNGEDFNQMVEALCNFIVVNSR